LVQRLRSQAASNAYELWPGVDHIDALTEADTHTHTDTAQKPHRDIFAQAHRHRLSAHTVQARMHTHSQSLACLLTDAHISHPLLLRFLPWVLAGFPLKPQGTRQALPTERCHAWPNSSR
jgi:hypothetical protein